METKFLLASVSLNGSDPRVTAPVTYLVRESDVAVFIEKFSKESTIIFAPTPQVFKSNFKPTK